MILLATAATIMALLGHGERDVVARLGPPPHVDKAPAGETWYYAEACLELEGGQVRSGCWRMPQGHVCYYDGAKPRPAERPCSRKWR